MAIGALLDIIGGLFDAVAFVGTTTEAGRRRVSRRRLAIGWCLAIGSGVALWHWFEPFLLNAGGWAVAATLLWVALLIYMVLASLATVLRVDDSGKGSPTPR